MYVSMCVKFREWGIIGDREGLKQISHKNACVAIF